ncbi:hypothetical protein [Pararhizobium sp. PWRC1-1]|uniref:hypothetical protein n=1 Tax=Pararhizobium sp. PWRC1-1 TaxID=2804566 RepID=UPI003CE689B9
MMGRQDVYVIKAYDMNANGDLHSAIPPRHLKSEMAAIEEARSIAPTHDGVAVCKQAVDPAIGYYGPEMLVFHMGQIPGIG